MDTLLSILAVVCGLTGVAGCFLPVLPGPPVAYLGLLLVHWTDYAQFSGEYLALWAVLTGAVTLADYLLPAWITGRLGGSRQATRGAAIGTLAGLFFMPWGLVLGPFAGAFIERCCMTVPIMPGRSAWHSALFSPLYSVRG